MCASIGDAFVDLPQRCDVIKHPETASMRRNDEIVLVHQEVTHGCVRQIQLQRLPVIAVAE